MRKIVLKSFAMLCLLLISLFFTFGCNNGSSNTNATPNEYFTFNLLNDGTYEIGLNYDGDFDSIDDIPTELVLPSTYNKKAVTSIAEWGFKGYYTLTSVVIPDSIASIGMGAFAGCESLTNIKVSKNNEMLQSIDGNVYTKNGKTILQYAVGKKDSSFIIPEAVTAIGDGAFAGARFLTSVNIPDMVTTIGKYAFTECISLTSVKIPDRVTKIDNFAFNGCEALVSIEIGRNVANIGSGVFDQCFLLADVNVNYLNGVMKAIDGILYTKDGKRLWRCLPGVKGAISIPSGVEIIGDGAFYQCPYITSVEIPSGVNTIGDSAFWSCSALESVVIPNSVTSIGNYAFSGCTSLSSINIPNGLRVIAKGTFFGCRLLTSIEIPNGVTSIGEEAFIMCDGLIAIKIPNSVITIGARAFGYCFSLSGVVLPSSVQTIGVDAFVNCGDIYCESQSQPSGWNNDWVFNSSVYWYSETQPTEQGNYWHYVDDVLTKW